MQVDLDTQDASCARFMFRGTEGMIDANESWVRLFNAETNGWQELDLGVPREKVDTIGGKANGRQTKELIRWVEGGPVHRCAGSSARVTVEILMALLESARKNQVVRLPLQEKGYPLELMMQEGLLEPTEKGAYDIRGYLNREGVDEKRYAELRAQGMSHHPIMRKLNEEKMAKGQ